MTNPSRLEFRNMPRLSLLSFVAALLLSLAPSTIAQQPDGKIVFSSDHDGNREIGLSTDTPAPPDYDGDGKAHAAVFRIGTWYLKWSSSGTLVQQVGLQNDQPSPLRICGDDPHILERKENKYRRTCGSVS